VQKERAMKLQPELADLFELPPAERLQLVEDLWDSLIPREAELPVSDWVANELRERKKRFDANPAAGMTWEEVVRGLDEH
jgi:putative addiction module component (TIGR02574 family)